MENIIRTIINNWDPINLFPAAPDNEYQAEIKAICSFINSNKNDDANALGRKIREVFIDSFGNDVFLKTLKQCEDIACKMNLLLAEIQLDYMRSPEGKSGTSMT